MIQHVCLISYKDKAAVTEAVQRSIEEAYQQLLGLIPGLLSMKVGRDLNLLEGNYDLAIVAMFDDKASFKAYSVHKAHEEVIFPVLGPHMASYCTTQFALS